MVNKCSGIKLNDNDLKSLPIEFFFNTHDTYSCKLSSDSTKITFENNKKEVLAIDYTDKVKSLFPEEQLRMYNCLQQGGNAKHENPRNPRSNQRKDARLAQSLTKRNKSKII